MNVNYKIRNTSAVNLSINQKNKTNMLIKDCLQGINLKYEKIIYVNQFKKFNFIDNRIKFQEIINGKYFLKLIYRN